MSAEDVVGLSGEVVVASDPASACAEWLCQRARSHRTRPDRFAIALAGGTTPRTLYVLLATPPWRERFDWGAWEVFFGDERAVPPDHPQSNYRLVAETLLAGVAIPSQQVHRMPADWPDLEAAADAYADLLASRLPEGPNRAPRLDVVLLGLGEDGHTASLFPGTPALEVRDRFVVPGEAPVEPRRRLTVTYPTLDAAAAIAFLVTGANKGPALRATAAGTTPAARVRPIDGELRWFLDEAAAEAMAAGS